MNHFDHDGEIEKQKQKQNQNQNQNQYQNENHNHHDNPSKILPFKKLSKEERTQLYNEIVNEFELLLPANLAKIIIQEEFESKQGMVEKMILLSHKILEESRFNSEEFEQYFDSPKRNISLPLFGTMVSCGFVSPADTYIENELSLDKEFVPNPKSTFFARAIGDCMNPTIKSGDLLVIDRSVEARNGKVILAVIDGEYTVKRIFKTQKELILKPDNPLFNEIKITPDCNFEVWGVVTAILSRPD